MFKYRFLCRLLLTVVLCAGVLSGSAAAVTNPQSGSVGLQGQISAPPPTQGATIAFPLNGQSFSKLPINVTGLCPKGLLVKVFKNNVFAGSVDCTNGSYSVSIDLFNDRNELVARVYDALDQAGPDSNIVTVTFNDGSTILGPRVSVTTNYAKRGAPPGSILTWPITISGGTGPYAVSVDWGDKKSPDIISRPFGGEFNITHTYDSAGVYNVIIKVTDKNGQSAFLQVVGVGNGPIAQDTAAANSKTPTTIVQQKLIWWPLAVLIPLILTTFWLGRRHQLTIIRKKLERGDRPF